MAAFAPPVTPSAGAALEEPVITLVFCTSPLRAAAGAALQRRHTRIRGSPRPRLNAPFPIGPTGVPAAYAVRCFAQRLTGGLDAPASDAQHDPALSVPGLDSLVR